MRFRSYVSRELKDVLRSQFINCGIFSAAFVGGAIGQQAVARLM
jgi:hypothetical protein